MDNAPQQFPLHPKIAIAGSGGMVGGALLKWFPQAIQYDPPKELDGDLNKADIVFICVPTPYDDGFDLTAVQSVIRNLNQFQYLEGEKIVVIKSTVLPGTTQDFQDQYPQHIFLFNPEFLTEASADQDFQYPDRQIIGYTEQSFTVAADILSILPLAPHMRMVPSKEAEMIKYGNNTWFAAKVIFANQIYDLCKKMDIDYDTVKSGMAMDKRMTGTSHLEIFHKGSRGFGGKCLPKDLSALLWWAEKNGVDMTLLKEVDRFNREVLKPNK